MQNLREGLQWKARSPEIFRDEDLERKARPEGARPPTKTP